MYDVRSPAGASHFTVSEVAAIDSITRPDTEFGTAMKKISAVNNVTSNATVAVKPKNIYIYIPAVCLLANASWPRLWLSTYTLIYI